MALLLRLSVAETLHLLILASICAIIFPHHDGQRVKPTPRMKAGAGVSGGVGQPHSTVPLSLPGPPGLRGSQARANREVTKPKHRKAKLSSLPANMLLASLPDMAPGGGERPGRRGGFGSSGAARTAPFKMPLHRDMGLVPQGLSEEQIFPLETTGVGRGLLQTGQKSKQYTGECARIRNVKA